MGFQGLHALQSLRSLPFSVEEPQSSSEYARSEPDSNLRVHRGDVESHGRAMGFLRGVHRRRLVHLCDDETTQHNMRTPPNSLFCLVI